MQPHRYLLCARSGVTLRTGPNQNQTPHHRFCQFSVESSDGSFSTSIFPWFALILPALFQLLPHSALDSFLWVRARLFVQATFSSKGFYAIKFFSKLRHLFHACQVPLDYSWEWCTQESVVYARTTHVGFRSAALHCTWDQRDKQYTAEN